MSEHIETPTADNVDQFINIALQSSAGWIGEFDEQTFLPLKGEWPTKLCDNYATYSVYNPSILAYGGSYASINGAGVYSIFKRPYSGYTMYKTRIAL